MGNSFPSTPNFIMEISFKLKRSDRRTHLRNGLISHVRRLRVAIYVTFLKKTKNKMERKEEQKRFSIVKRAKSFSHALRGLWIFARSTHNAWVHITIAVVVIVFGIYLHIAYTDWMLIIFASGLVLASEAFNTAIEIDIDLTSPEYHPYARDTKDVSAGAVLIAAMTAALIGILIFSHYFIL
jgi:diacylglycerol kinase (ATP)